MISVIATRFARVSCCVEVPTRPGCTVVEVAFGRVVKAMQVVVVYLHCSTIAVTGWAKATRGAPMADVVKVPAVAFAKAVVPMRRMTPVALCSATYTPSPGSTMPLWAHVTVIVWPR
jgi:hypothetical protein